MKYLYTLLITLTSCHLGAMELPNTDTQWADTPAKDAMARFSQEKLVLFGDKEYSATPIQHAYLELLRETSGKDSQIYWKNLGVLGMWENANSSDTRTKLVELMHYMTKNYDLQVLLGFGSDSNLLLYGKNYQQTWPIVDANMLSTMESMGVDVSGFISKPAINDIDNSQLIHCAAPAPQEQTLSKMIWADLSQAWKKVTTQAVSYATPRNAALAVVGMGTAFYVGPKIKAYIEKFKKMREETDAIKTVLYYSTLHLNLHRDGATIENGRRAMEAVLPALGILGIRE